MIERTYDEDIAANPAIVGCDFIIIPYGQRPIGLSNPGSYKVDVNTKQLIIYPRLTVTIDKTQIQADGIDTATITSDHAESFSVDGGQEYVVNPFQFASTVPGTYIITAKSTLYGQNSVVVEVI
ncbi:hypothetical protein [Desulfosporosinus fructosivorans]